MARAKRKLPAKPAAFISPHHRGHFCPVIRYPNTKPRRRRQYTPHKNPRPGQTAPTDARTQKTRCRSEHHRPLSFLRTTAVTSAPSSDTRTQSPRRRQYTPHKNLTARSNGTDRCPNTKNPLPLRTPPAVSAFSKKTAALPKCHSSAPTTAGRRTTPPHTT